MRRLILFPLNFFEIIGLPDILGDMEIRATTILGVRVADECAIGGDGQVTLGDIAMKQSAKKIRKIYNDRILAGFAGSAADGMTLVSRFEEKLEAYSGNLTRAAVELGKDWRTDKFLRHLEAMLIVMDKERSLIVSGNGEIIEPDDGIIAIGSGAGYAISAARAFVQCGVKMHPKEICERSLKIAAGLCIYTNSNINILTL